MLDVVFSPKLFVFYLFVASGVYIHFRGRVRHGFLRQLTDHSTVMGPINMLVYAFSKTPNTPYLPLNSHEELRVFRDNWEKIAEEARKMYEFGHVRDSASSRDDAAFNSFFKTGWKRFYLKWYGEPLASARELCPTTVDLIEQVPSINAAMFTLLPPGAKLPQHRDPFAGSLRYHLGLMTPNDDACYISVDGQHYSWRDGEDVLFDETYIHYAKNETDQTRLIFFADVARPMRGPVSAWFNRSVGRALGKLTESPNTEADRTGGLNKIFRYVYKFREFAKAFKARNKPAYTLTKYSLFALLIYAIFFT
ncbi:peptide-aspartate beta-dioxygenase [gamma proteobacterium HTCC5015]|nr:peptide-aspartate beta-dioxygenase [gamma proteobacterium HTCC5015]